MSNFVRNNHDDLFNAIEKLIAMLSLSLNIGKNLEPHQLAPLAKEIYHKYYFYSIDEIALVFRKGAQGEFGKLFDKLDRSTIMEWFTIYDTRDRMPIVENHRTQQEEAQKQENTNSLYAMLGGDLGINKLKKELTPDEEKEANYQTIRQKYFEGKK